MTACGKRTRLRLLGTDRPSKTGYYAGTDCHTGTDRHAGIGHCSLSIYHSSLGTDDHHATTS